MNVDELRSAVAHGNYPSMQKAMGAPEPVGKVLDPRTHHEIDVYAKAGETPGHAIDRVKARHMGEPTLHMYDNVSDFYEEYLLHDKLLKPNKWF